jgi:cytochrome P450
VWDGRRLLTSQRNDSTNHSLTGIRDLRQHAQLRKPWNNAFQFSALIDYEDILRDRAAQFMTHLQKLSEDEVSFDLANLISFFSFVFSFTILFIIILTIL